jgi:hypothetical protein
VVHMPAASRAAVVASMAVVAGSTVAVDMAAVDTTKWARVRAI